MTLSQELSQCLACGDDCDHSDEEHTAFDAGVMAGCDGQEAEANPYDNESLREAWATGHAVGLLSRED